MIPVKPKPCPSCRGDAKCCVIEERRTDGVVDLERGAHGKLLYEYACPTCRDGSSTLVVHASHEDAIAAWNAHADAARIAALEEVIRVARVGFLGIRDMMEHGASSRTVIDWMRNNAGVHALSMQRALQDDPPDRQQPPHPPACECPACWQQMEAGGAI